MTFDELNNRDKWHFLNFSITYFETEEPEDRRLIYEYFIRLNTFGKVMDKEHLEKIKTSIEKKKVAYEENLSLYNRLRSEIKENEKNLQWRALKQNTERIIEILPLIEKDGEISTRFENPKFFIILATAPALPAYFGSTSIRNNSIIS